MKTGKGENYLFYAARKRAMKIVQMRQMKGIFKGNGKKYINRLQLCDQ